MEMYFLSCFRHIYIITLILTLGIKSKRLPSGSFQKTFAGAPLTTPFMLATRVVPVEGMFQNQRPGHCKRCTGDRCWAATVGGEDASRSQAVTLHGAAACNLATEILAGLVTGRSLFAKA